MRDDILKQARRVVVKIGSSLVASREAGLRPDRIDRLSEEISAVKAGGREDRDIADVFASPAADLVRLARALLRRGKPMILAANKADLASPDALDRFAQLEGYRAIPTAAEFELALRRAAASRLIPHPPNFAPIGAMALFGGMHMTWGPILGAVILGLASEYLKLRIPYGHLLVYGIIVVIAILFFPKGIVGTIGQRLQAK